MRSLPASLGVLLLAIALIVAPLPVANLVLAIQPAPAADTCCGCCPVVDTTCETAAQQSCCSNGTEAQETDEPCSSEPCGSDCGQCPCCAVVVPAPLAILTHAGQTLQPSHFAAVVVASDLLSTRSEEPLLPPPRG